MTSPNGTPPLITPEEVEALSQRVTARDIERLTSADITRAIHLLHLEGYVMGFNKTSGASTLPGTRRSRQELDEAAVNEAVATGKGQGYTGGRPDASASLIMGDLSLSKKKVVPPTGGDDIRRALLAKEGLVAETLSSSQYTLGGHSILDSAMKVMLREHKVRLATKGASDNVMRSALDAVNVRGTGMAYYWLVKEPHNQHAVLGYIPDSWKVAVEGVAARLLGSKTHQPSMGHH